jgi:hypothetical protein
MNAKLFLVSLCALPVAALAQQPQRYDPPTAGESPPVQLAPDRRHAQVTLADEQKLYAPAGTLVAPEQASAVIDKFKAAYEKLGKPRMLIYVNRELVDDATGLKLTRRTERVEATRTEAKSDRDVVASSAPAAAPGTVTEIPGKGSATATTERVNAENSYEAKNAKAPTLADRQTVRDIERLFGRPLRLGGATLTDQKVAATLIADKPMSQFMVVNNDQARKDREAPRKVADVVIEILVASRQLTVPEISGNRTFTAPDISATAIRLSDAAILGQASARDVLGKDRDAGRIVRQFDINDIAEATALALMEDMTLGAK